MIENIVLGIVTGVTDLLPFSTIKVVYLIKNYFFGQASLAEVIPLVWFLELGSAIALLVYFRKDIKNIFRTIFKYRSSDGDSKKTLLFLVITTLISGFIAIMIREVAISVNGKFLSSNLVNILVSIMLFLTAVIYNRSKKANDGKILLKKENELKEKDRFIVGVAQGFSIFPGLSRTGLTAGFLLLQRYSVDTSIRLSLLMSLPMIIGANLVENFGKFNVTPEILLGVIFGTFFSYITLSLIFKYKEKLDWSQFAVVFGFIILLSTFMK